MDFKDYLRVIRRRAIEFCVVFAVILVTYLLVSVRERPTFTANALLKVGERTDISPERAALLFQKNLDDLSVLLTARGEHSIREDFLRYLNEKILVTDRFETASQFDQNLAALPERELFYATTRMSGFNEVTTFEKNYNELRQAIVLIREELQKLQIAGDEGGVMSFLRQRVAPSHLDGPDVYAVNVPQGSGGVVELHVRVHHKPLAPWLVNEFAHYASKRFNEHTLESVKTKLTRIDAFWAAPDRDHIEREYNEAVYLYREYLKAAGDFDRQRECLFQLRDLFDGRFNNFEVAFDVDETRQTLKKIIEQDIRYKGARESHGLNGGVPITPEQMQVEMNNLSSRAQQLQGEQASLVEELQLLQVRESSDTKEFRRTRLMQSDSMRGLQAELKDARLELAALRQRYTDDHPSISAAFGRIERTRQLIAELEEDFKTQSQVERDMRRQEIAIQLDFVGQLLSSTEDELDEYKKRSLKVTGMNFYVKMLEAQRDRLVERATDLSEELQGLMRIYDSQRVARVDRPASKANPVKRIYNNSTLMLTVIVGFAVALFIVYVRESMDSTIKSEQDVRRHINLPIVAMVGRVRQEQAMLTAMAQKEPFAESFNAGAALIRSAAKDLDINSIMVTSTLPKEGKTTVVTNFGVALARQGCKVLIIDMDFRIPRVHEALGLDNATGMSTWLTGRLGPGVSPAASLVRTTAVPGLEAIPTGPIPEDPQALLAGPKLRNLIPKLEEIYDFVLIDTPPVFNVADALTVAGFCDATLFVVGSELVQQDQVAWAKHLLQNVNADVLGVVLNFVRLTGRSYDYYYNGYKAYRSRG